MAKWCSPAELLNSANLKHRQEKMLYSLHLSGKVMVGIIWQPDTKRSAAAAHIHRFPPADGRILLAGTASTHLPTLPADVSVQSRQQAGKRLPAPAMNLTRATGHAAVSTLVTMQLCEAVPT